MLSLSALSKRKTIPNVILDLFLCLLDVLEKCNVVDKELRHVGTRLLCALLSENLPALDLDIDSHIPPVCLLYCSFRKQPRCAVCGHTVTKPFEISFPTVHPANLQVTFWRLCCGAFWRLCPSPTLACETAIIPLWDFGEHRKNVKPNRKLQYRGVDFLRRNRHEMNVPHGSNNWAEIVGFCRKASQS